MFFFLLFFIACTCMNGQQRRDRHVDIAVPGEFSLQKVQDFGVMFFAVNMECGKRRVKEF